MRTAVLAVMALLIPHPGGLAAAQRDLDRPGPLERAAHPVSADNPLPARTLTVMPGYPPDAAAIDASARVSLHVTVDELGRVAELRPLNAPQLVFARVPAAPERLRAAAEALVRAARDAVAQWQYETPVRAPLGFNVTIRFAPGSDPVLMPETIDRAEAARARAVDRPVDPPAPEDPAWAEGAVRVGPQMTMPTRVGYRAPQYPETARQSRIQGVVVLDIRIDEAGRVTKARVVRSVPELDQAATDAVMQWQFAPTLMNGAPVPLVVTVAVSFNL